jgi:energy-coupling factor transporter transmembrane protein EcfT
LHPSCALLVCLTAIAVIQFLGHVGLGMVLLVLLARFDLVFPRWCTLLRRMRWLFLTVWLILAYSTAGEAVFDLAWLPTREGIAEATLHVARLALMLGCLAWLFTALGKNGLQVALVSLLRPLSMRGVATDRLVVRLSLVMENLREELPKGTWRRMLEGHAEMVDGPTSLRVEAPAWRRTDYVVCLGVLMFSIVAIYLG